MDWAKASKHHHCEEYNLYSSDGKRLALCDWDFGRNIWRVCYKPSSEYAGFSDLTDAKVWILQKMFEQGG